MEHTIPNGTRVLKSGHEGTVTGEYLPGMYEVRLARGSVVVPGEELTIIELGAGTCVSCGQGINSLACQVGGHAVSGGVEDPS